jgi:pyoverdine/dityrosine biosynthesis protein Dit1
MSSFVSTEFNCSHWQNVFLEKAKEEFTNQQKNAKKKTLKPKQQDQEITTIKNQLIKTKASVVVPQLITKGKQFSTLVTQEFPHYNECIRLSVHCDKDEIDLSHKIPISLIYGHFGTPWHNAIVVNQDECCLFKDVFKKSSFSDKQVVSFEIPTKQNKIISLQYIKN